MDSQMPEQAPGPRGATMPGPDDLAPRGVGLVLGFAGVLLLLAVGWWSRGLLPDRVYPSGTAEEMLDSMQAMIERKEAERLVELIELLPDTEGLDPARLEDLYARVGGLLGALQDLGDTIASTFPEELETFRVDLERSAERGESTSLFAMFGGGSSGNGFGPFGSGEGQERAMNALTAMLADPYSSLAEGRDRIGTQRIDGTRQALLWDDRAILPPFGLIARQGDDGHWRVVPPTSTPVVRRFLPQNDDEVEIWASLITTLELTCEDLRKGIERGRIASLDDVADEAFEMVMVPAGMVLVAYGRAMESREQGP